jgi:hypothetical protein
MLEWTMRWGVPLALVATYLVMVDARGPNPSAIMQHLLDSVCATLSGLIPRFF